MAIVGQYTGIEVTVVVTRQVGKADGEGDSITIEATNP
jgi:hypothetical protein